MEEKPKLPIETQIETKEPNEMTMEDETYVVEAWIGKGHATWMVKAPR